MTGQGPGVHPDPPEDFAQRELPLMDFGGSLWRIYQCKYNSPIFFGKNVRNRFDAPQGEYGVCYCSHDEYGAFVETFGRGQGPNIVTQKALKSRSLIQIEVKEELRLVDLTGAGLKRLGADNRIASGGNYDVTRKWSRAVHEHPVRSDGLLYLSRNDPSRLCVAVFERAAQKVALNREWQLGSPAGLAVVLPVIEHYGFGVG